MRKESARERTLQTICASLRTPEVVALVRDTVKAGYAEFFDDKRKDACAMVDEAFVLHHVDAADLPRVIQRLAKIARHLVIKEDTYNVPGDLDRLAELIAAQPLLRRFVALPLGAQFQALVLIDFFANAIAQGVPEMNMPFEFKSIPEWRDLLRVNGIEVRGTLLAGFEPGRMHKSCHVWFVCERMVPAFAQGLRRTLKVKGER